MFAIRKIIIKCLEYKLLEAFKTFSRVLEIDLQDASCLIHILNFFNI